MTFGGGSLSFRFRESGEVTERMFVADRGRCRALSIPTGIDDLARSAMIFGA